MIQAHREQLHLGDGLIDEEISDLRGLLPAPHLIHPGDAFRQRSAGASLRCPAVALPTVGVRRTSRSQGAGEPAESRPRPQVSQALPPLRSHGR